MAAPTRRRAMAVVAVVPPRVAADIIPAEAADTRVVVAADTPAVAVAILAVDVTKELGDVAIKSPREAAVDVNEVKTEGERGVQNGTPFFCFPVELVGSITVVHRLGCRAQDDRNPARICFCGRGRRPFRRG